MNQKKKKKKWGVKYRRHQFAKVTKYDFPNCSPPLVNFTVGPSSSYLIRCSSIHEIRNWITLVMQLKPYNSVQVSFLDLEKNYTKLLNGEENTDQFKITSIFEIILSISIFFILFFTYLSFFFFISFQIINYMHSTESALRFARKSSFPHLIRLRFFIGSLSDKIINDYLFVPYWSLRNLKNISKILNHFLHSIVFNESGNGYWFYVYTFQNIF